MMNLFSTVRFTFVTISVSIGLSPVIAAAETGFIDCNDPCNGGDVNYELIPTIRTLSMMDGQYTYRGRAYANPESNDETNIMGPTIRVKPGQSLWIKMRNNITAGELGPNSVTVQDYWRMVQKPGERIKYQYYKKPTDTPEQMTVDVSNLPKNFDHTNLHLHGLDIQVHMFDPVGTHNPLAPHISIAPGQCYCYKFNLPEHHPPGMYWYHPHLHGSTALQIWSGMLGLLYIEGGPLEQELQKYGIVSDNTKEFVIWDPAFRAVDNKTTHNLEVDTFLMGQTTLSKIHPFLVNGHYNPTFNVIAGEVLHFRSLCATIENENTFIIYRQGEETNDWKTAALPFWVIAADGVTYAQPHERTILVMAGGQRYELLLLFDEPATYVISQQGIQGMQFFDMYGHPHDQTLATILVTAPIDENAVRRPNRPIIDMRFTPGYKQEEDIQAHDIVKTETIVFSMGANRDQAPFPQYYVNDKAFHPDRLDFFAQPGQAVEYILVNANHNVHPFHIHVNRFQVKEMGSELSTQKYPVLGAVLDFGPDNAWRDTVVVPPNGRTRIWVQYKNYTGKTVFHCHFLAHEDTGMMSTLFIGLPDNVFDWAEHMQLLLGLLCGMVVTATILLIFVPSSSPTSSRRLLSGRNGRTPEPYELEAMNQLKSKATD